MQPTDCEFRYGTSPHAGFDSAIIRTPLPAASCRRGTGAGSRSGNSRMGAHENTEDGGPGADDIDDQGDDGDGGDSDGDGTVVDCSVDATADDCDEQ